MNILIIDDQMNNTKLISSVLQDMGDTVKCYPPREEAKNFSDKIVRHVSKNSLQVLAKEIEWYILEKDIDIIILDLALNVSEENNNVIQTSGIALLNTLINNDKEHLKYIPFFVYSIMSTQELSVEIKANIVYARQKPNMTKRKIKADFNDNDNELFNILKLHANNYRVLKQKNCFNSIRYCDIVVICALKKEIMPVVTLLSLENDKIDTSKILYTGHIDGKDNKKLKVVAVTKEQMGMAEAATLTTQMIEKYNPKFVVMTGIAAGIDSEQNFLDILMPAYIHNWQSGKFKIIEDKTKTEEILHIFDREYSSVKTYIDSEAGINLKEDSLENFPENFLKKEGFEGDFTVEEDVYTYLEKIKKEPSKKITEFQRELCSLFKNEKAIIEKKIEEQKNSSEKEEKIKYLNEKLQQLSENDLVYNFIKEFTEDLKCKIYRGGMVSGSAVVADGEIVKNYIDSRGIKGIDMEAYGVTFACNHHPSKPNVLILKAICDFADETKNDIYQTAAAYVSAEAFSEIFKNNINVES